MKTNLKIKRLIAVTVSAAAGAQFALPALAADTTNPPAQVPGYTADANGGGSASQAEEIRELKAEVDALVKKVDQLEKQQATSQPVAQQATIDNLDQQVRILERERENDRDDAAALTKTQPKFSIGSSGFNAISSDSNFVFSLKGVLQLDNRSFFNKGVGQGADSFLLRRARPIFQGTVYKDFDFQFTPDFGGSSVQIFDAYANYRYAPWLQLRAGKFKTPIGLEQLQADVNTSFNERSLVTDLVPNRDIGFQLWGDIDNGLVSYAVGAFNGVGDARNSSNQDFDNHREVVARVFTQPFHSLDIPALQNFGVGLAGGFGDVTSNATDLTSGYTTDGQQTFFAYNPTSGTVVADGDHWRLSPQGYYYYGPFSLLGEYVVDDQKVRKSQVVSADLQNTAWEITGGWVLTGENASYNGVIPLHPFDLQTGHFGAFQVVGRYAELDIDHNTFPTYANPLASASKAQAWSVGLNWYLNKNIRVNTSFSHTSFSGGGGAGTTAPAIVTRQPEEVLFTRVQLAF